MDPFEATGAFAPLQIAVGIAIMGIKIWANPPRLGNAWITIDKEATAPEAPEEGPSGTEGGYRDSARTKPTDTVKIFSFRIEPKSGEGQAIPFSIGISQRTGRIDWESTDRQPFGKERRGSAALGVFILSLPITLPIGVPLLAYNAYYTRMEREWGLSRHARVILDAIRGQLDEEDFAKLEWAFRKTWADEKKMEMKVSFSEARTHLRRYERLTRLTRTFWNGDFEEFTRYEWHDANGEVMATGRSHPKERCQIKVFGTEFTGEQARQLSQYYDTTREIPET